VIQKASISDSPREDSDKSRQIILVLQGRGAYGAYHGGVYEALHEAGLEPHWIIGTSMGAVNGSLIAGSAPSERLDRLKAFWGRLTQGEVFDIAPFFPQFSRTLSKLAAFSNGIDGFFAPNPLAFLGLKMPLPVGSAGLYKTKPLEQTLGDLVDFTALAKSPIRLTVGAAHISTSEMRYFDSRDMALTIRHIMASGALPPAFTPIDVDGINYWGGDLLSNTPVDAIFDDNPRRSSLAFSVQTWHSEGALPETMWEVLIRSKEMLYSSATSSHILRQKQIHHLRHVVTELAAKLPPEIRESEAVRAMTAFGCPTMIHVVRLLAPRDKTKDQMGEIDFSSANISERWAAGYEDTKRAIEKAPWQQPVDPLEGVYLHEFQNEAVEAR
jgi:NTE family protein